MCLELERMECKSFQFFPLQTNCIPKHIQLDTKALVELFVDTTKHQKLLDVWIKTETSNKPKNKTKVGLYSCLESNKEFIWDEFFNISQTRNNYAFDYTIITDGYSVSLRFLHTNYVEAEKTKKNKMKEAKKALSGLTKEEKDTRKAEKETKLKELLKNRPKPAKKTKTVELSEFPYIDEVPKEMLEGKHIFIDP